MKRKIRIERLDEDHDECALYVFTFEDEETPTPEYHKFWNKFENCSSLQWEFDVINERLNTITKSGAEDLHFREEGKAVKALPIDGGELRLYCYRIDTGILIIGNGGIKKQNPIPEKNKLINFPELYVYAETIRQVGKLLEEDIRKKIVKRAIDSNNLIGLTPYYIEMPNAPKP